MNNPKAEFLKIPKSDIKKLEEARLYLHDLFKNKPMIANDIMYGSTDIIYSITHKKYEEIE